MLDTLDTVKVCVAYDVDGARVEHLPYHQSDLHAATPIYEELPGLEARDLTAVTEPDHLPREAAGLPAPSSRSRSACRSRFVGTGPGRDAVRALRRVTVGRRACDEGLRRRQRAGGSTPWPSCSAARRGRRDAGQPGHPRLGRPTPPEDIDADLFVIGPEVPLVDGLADRLRAQGSSCSGRAPTAPASRGRRPA